MASKQNVVINVLLYYLLNNVENFNNESFVHNTSNFYTSEEILSAKKTLNVEIEHHKLDNLDKHSTQATTKRDKLTDLISMINIIIKASLLIKIPIFVSSNFKRIPKNNSIIEMNFDILKKEILEIINKQQVDFVNLLNLNCAEIVKLKNDVHSELFEISSKVNTLSHNTDLLAHTHTAIHNNSNTVSLVTNDLSKCSMSSLPPSSNDLNNNCFNNKESTNSGLSLQQNSALTHPYINQLWSDTAENPELRQAQNNLSTDGFTTVVRRRHHTNTSNKLITNQNVPRKPIKGTCTTENLNLKANRKLIEKSHFHVGNVGKCTKQKMVDFLSSQDINVISCFPLFKKSVDSSNHPHPTSDSATTSFKVTIDSKDLDKFCNPNIWPEYIVINSWILSERPRHDKTDVNLNNKDAKTSDSNSNLISNGV